VNKDEYYYPRDAMRKCGLCCHRVPVCPSVSYTPVSRAQVTGRAEFTSEQLRMREINTVNIRCWVYRCSEIWCCL